MAPITDAMTFEMKMKDTLRELPIDPRLMFVLERLVEQLTKLEGEIQLLKLHGETKETGKKPPHTIA